MKIALPHREGRVSPVFDVAGAILVVEVIDGRETRRDGIVLEAAESMDRARQVRSLGVDLLICGGISRQLEMAVAAMGIRVISHICGGVDDVLLTFLQGRIEEDDGVWMPGCRRSRRRSRAGGGQGLGHCGWSR